MLVLLSGVMSPRNLSSGRVIGKVTPISNLEMSSAQKQRAVNSMASNILQLFSH